VLLEIVELTKRFGGLSAVSDVSFSIASGEIVGIFGPNGSGKTTLLNLIAGILAPTAGRILWK
jgi:ABC-type branched-subunit amino acid transport system ATPase component